MACAHYGPSQGSPQPPEPSDSHHLGWEIRQHVAVLWRAVPLLVLVLADLAMWAIAFVGTLAENCYGDVSTLGCSSFAKNTAAPLGIVGIIVVVAVVGVFADQRSRGR